MMHGWAVEGLETSLGGFRLGPVDLTLSPGRALAVLGPSGAGKTTLLRTLAGFLPLTGGRILRDGEEISRWRPEERSLGYVPQGLGLLPHKTAEANVRYPLDVRGRPDAIARTRELLEAFGLERLARRYPSQLSGGEQQRVALARALAAEPGLILWDEPWQGLDVIARHALGETLHQLRQSEAVPIVVVTHDPALAFSVADTFLVLYEGRVREQCDAATLLRAPGDPFAARFVGFENVFDPENLEPGAPGTLRAWLRERSGPEGVAFASPTLSVGESSTEAWEGRVRSARPHPEGLVVEVVVDGLMLHLRVPPPLSARFPAPGDRVRVQIDPVSLLTLGPHPHTTPKEAPAPSTGMTAPEAGDATREPR
jgi:ABC-type Fe3+/spermidine/putrescine transport system ATPase subunit